jgi:hypothetical protein
MRDLFESIARAFFGVLRLLVMIVVLPLSWLFFRRSAKDSPYGIALVLLAPIMLLGLLRPRRDRAP